MRVKFNEDVSTNLVSKTAYTIGGVEVLPDDVTAILLIEKYSDGSHKYYAKMNRHRELFTHLNSKSGMLELHKRDKKLKEDMWIFKPIRHDVYELYHAYVRTKNVAHLLRAQRTLQSS